MNSLKTVAAAGLIASTMALAPSGAHAQTAGSAAGSSFDAYRVVAITAGVIAGAAVAVIVTDGLIIPVYAYATGATATGAGAVGAGAGAGAGGGAGGGMMGYWGGPMAHAGYEAVRGGMRILGGIGGGFYADSWYTGQ